MSRKFKKHYTAFNRAILKEFLTEEELAKLDKQYTEAKIKRMIDRIKEATK